MSDNKLVIAAAGSGKTTFLINEALARPSERILITTYTQSNEAEIRRRFLGERKCIPANITVQTWFSFLLQHGVRPFQGSMDSSLYSDDVTGMLLVNEQSGLRYRNRQGRPVYFSEAEHFRNHYFTRDGKIYSDKVSKFVVKCDRKTGSAVVGRIGRLFDHIFVDEVQDLAGYDLELIKLLFAASSGVTLVGDPRQVTYLTHLDSKYRKYRDGQIKDFVSQELGRNINCEIDESTLTVSHRNNEAICALASKLYPALPPTNSCECCVSEDIDHAGVFLVSSSDVSSYCMKYGPVQLRWSKAVVVDNEYPMMSFGESKGKTLDRVLIYPTEKMVEWLINPGVEMSSAARAKFYVALTRARHSTAIIVDDEKISQCNNLEIWEP